MLNKKLRCIVWSLTYIFYYFILTTSHLNRFFLIVLIKHSKFSKNIYSNSFLKTIKIVSNTKLYESVRTNWIGAKLWAEKRSKNIREMGSRCLCLRHFSHVQLFETPWTIAHQAPSVYGNFPNKNTGVGCLILLQGSYWPWTWVSFFIFCMAGGFFTTSSGRQ